MDYSFGPRFGINLKPVGNCFSIPKVTVVTKKRLFIEYHFNVPRLLKASWNKAYEMFLKGSSDMI